jgi:CHAT domain-containing protein/lipopolysaccharide biosynthesis regulator YciM
MVMCGVPGMMFNFSGLRLVALAMLVWGLPTQVRAEFGRPALGDSVKTFDKPSAVRQTQALEPDGRLRKNLQDASGSEVTRNDDGSEGTNAEIVFRLSETEEYRLMATAYEASGQEPYQLTVAAADEQVPRQTALKAEADSLFQQGIEAYRVSQYQTALAAWQSALEIYRELGDRQGEANALGSLGIACYSLGEYQRAIDFQNQYLAIAREISDHQGEANALGNLANAYYSLGAYQQAIDFLEQSLAIAREIGSRQGEASALGNLGGSYYSLGEYQQAIDFHQQYLLIAQEIGDRQGEANALGNLGLAYRSLGEYQRAIDFHQQHLAIVREIGDRQGEATSLGNLGIAYINLGEYQRAINFFQQSLAIVREIGDRQGEANALGNLGIAYRSLGEHQQAIVFQQQYLSIARELGYRQGEANALGNLGGSYYSLGEYQQAIDFQQQYLSIARELGDRQGEANALGSLGIAYISLGEYQKAIDFQQQHLSIARELGDRQGEATSLGNLGLAYDGLGEYQRAIDIHQQSLAIAREIGARQGEAASLGNLGNAYDSLGEYQRAIDFLAETLAIARELGDRQGEAISLANLGASHLNLEQVALAQESLLKSIVGFESLRSVDLPDQNRISFFETQISAYRNLESALVSQDKFETALEISERGRTQSFVQLLSEKLSSAPEHSELTQAPSFSEIQRVAIEQQSTLVEYSISRNTSGNGLSLYIWLVQPTGELHFKEVAIGESLAEVSALVEQSRQAMAIRGRGGLVSAAPTSDATAQLRQLHQLLIEPIADWLPSDPNQRVVFIPQGELFLVPFPSLQDESGTYLIERHTILTAPSIQVMDLTRRRATTATNRSNEPTDILTVGNPVMPEVWNPESEIFTQLPSLSGAEQEAKVIANFFSTEALIGAQATEQTIKQQIENARIIHFATHGLLEYGIPEESGVRDVPGAIALAPGQDEDGLLTAAEIIEELQLQADLVVLSACDTGLGRVTGDGVIGLSRSLIAAGASSVIVSLWSIPDAPTAELMVEFYRQRQQGQDKAQALRQAMLITMKTHPNPRDWAAFTLIGEAN